MIDLSVLVVNWNTRDLLAQCVQSVYDTVGGVEFEVIVVDNGSTDGSQAMLRERFPAIHMIANEENAGFTRANNQAIGASRGRYVLLLNSDTIVQPGALEAMVRFADCRPEAGIIGCQLLNADLSLQLSWAQFPTFWSELWGCNVRKRRSTADALAYEVDWVGGACLLARREAIEQVGPLDEGFFMYSEEADWCFRMVKSGWKVYYLLGGQVVHLGGRSTQQVSDRMLVQLYQSKLRFFGKHYGPFSEGLLRASLILTSLAKGWGLALWSLLKKVKSPTGHPYGRYWMLASELWRGRRVTGSA